MRYARMGLMVLAVAGLMAAGACDDDSPFPDELFGRAQAELGVGPLVEAVGLVGHYNFISMVARTFDLDVSPGTVTF